MHTDEINTAEFKLTPPGEETADIMYYKKIVGKVAKANKYWYWTLGNYSSPPLFWNAESAFEALKYQIKPKTYTISE